MQPEKVNETLFNLSYEPPEFNEYKFILNFSHSELSKNIQYLNRSQKIQDLYIQIEKKINTKLSFKSMVIQRISDLGYAAQFEIKQSLSKSHDLRFGTEYFANKENTAFSQLKDFTRIYVGITSYTSN